MDIMRPRAWRLCGWAATALFGGITTLTTKILYDGRGMSTRMAPVLVIMSVACALLTGIRLFAPPIAKMRQQLELNLGLQRRVLTAIAPPNPPTLTLVPPLHEQPQEQLPDSLADTIILDTRRRVSS